MDTEKNTSQSTSNSLRTAAIVAGLGLLIMAVLAPIVEFNVFQGLVVLEDAKTTTENLIASVGIFRTGIFIFLIVAILDVVVAWALYVLFLPFNKKLSLLAAWFRVIYAAILAMALNNLFHVLRLVTQADYFTLAADDLYTHVMLFWNAFRDGWDIAILFFAIHLIILGYLSFVSETFPKWLGILLVIAGLGYLIDSVGKFLYPNYNLTIALFTFFGEPVLMFYLLWKGIKGFEKVPEQTS